MPKSKHFERHAAIVNKLVAQLSDELADLNSHAENEVAHRHIIDAAKALGKIEANIFTAIICEEA